MVYKRQVLQSLYLQLDGHTSNHLQNSASQAQKEQPALNKGDRSEISENKSPSVRILYVDDEPSISKVIKYGLERLGFSVDAFTSPGSVLSSFRAGVYDILLIDVRLPEIDGLELCSQLLKADGKAKVCFITAYDLEEEEVRRRIAGLKSACIIKKPVSFEVLVAKINDEMRCA